jgi:8-oxo-dGTP pyrophosphatase MutT (NUDIX family)
VTVIPASGSLRSNVARWHGQLHEAASEQERDAAVDAALAAAEEVDVAGTKATVVLLLAPEAAESADRREAILGAMIPVEGSSALFVKFKGDAAVARRELIEEVGLKAEQFEMILEMQLSNSTTDEISYTYIARGLTYVGEEPEEDERLTIKKLPFEEVYQMVLRGEIRDALAVGSILKAKVVLDGAVAK